jgi:hypothetical protein
MTTYDINAIHANLADAQLILAGSNRSLVSELLSMRGKSNFNDPARPQFTQANDSPSPISGREIIFKKLNDASAAAS